MNTGLLWRLARARRGADGRRAWGDQGGDPPPQPGTDCQRDLAYGEHPRQRLDLYRPHGASLGPLPLILYVHGGGWRRGDKALPRLLGHKPAHWSSRGWAFAAMNYRLWPEADVLAQCEDLAQAIAFLQRRAQPLALDPSRLMLVGHSAGAQLAALLVASPARVAAAGVVPWRGTVVVDTAALDMVEVMQRPHYRFYDPVFGPDPAYWAAVSATRVLDGPPATPVLLLHGAARDDARRAAQGFAERARACGGSAAVLPLPLGHGDLNDSLGMPGPCTQAIEAFAADPRGETLRGPGETAF